MPISRNNSHKSDRKWKRIGKITKYLKWENGASNKKPDVDINKYIQECLNDIIKEG